MLPSRYAPSVPSSAMRKSRLEGKQSLLPKPKPRPGSTDRLSNDSRRPSTAGHRSSSAEPRSTFGGGRLSREASATKLPINGRSRSQTAEQRYGQTSMTPLRNSVYSRPTTTPQRTPSEDRSNRNWQTSLDRALAFVTVKDQRPLSAVGWQRSVYTRVQEALAARGGVSGGAGAALVRPLTITRFVDIVGGLLNCVTQDAKLNNDNYVTKLPHLSKRFLYPGAVSKSWLKTVNTLHAFPQALALIAYFLDLLSHIEEPVSYEWMYAEKDELACLKRDYLYKCWIRFQDPGHQFEDLNEEYLQNLRALLGNHDERIAELRLVIQRYQSCLDDEAEADARAQEAALVSRRDALLSHLGELRARRRQNSAQAQAAAALRSDLVVETAALAAELEPAMAESQKLKLEIEQQTLTIAERTKLQDEIYYAIRVVESKHSLAEQIDKMLQSKELELALWQKKTLDSCVRCRQGLIRQAAEFPSLAALAIDEKELMEETCAAQVSTALTTLRALAGELTARRAATARCRTAQHRQRAALAEEVRAKISELKLSIAREQQALDGEAAEEARAAARAAADAAADHAKMDALRASQAEYTRVDSEAEFWETQDLAWRTKLSSMQEYISEQKVKTKRFLEEAKAKRAKLMLDTVRQWNLKLEGTEQKVER